jgi:protein SCO1
MLSRTSRVTVTIGILFAVMGLMAGFFLSQHLDKKKHPESILHGTLLESPRDIKPFSLTGIDRKPYTNASLQGSWTMMFFGFTRCGSICPTTMAELGKMYRILEAKGVKNLPNVVMISIDPERDSLNKLSHYVKAFDSHFYGAKGNQASIDAMTHELGIAYFKMARKDVDKVDDYTIEHTGTIMLFNPQGKLMAFFTMPHKADLLANDYLILN